MPVTKGALLELTVPEEVGFVEATLDELEASSSPSSQSSGMVPVCVGFELEPVVVAVLLLEPVTLLEDDEGFLLPVVLLVPTITSSPSVPLRSEPVCSTTDEDPCVAEGVGPFLSFFLPQPESEQTAKSVQSTKQSAMLKNFLIIKAYLNLSKYQKNFIIYKKVCQHGFYLL